MAYIQTEWKNGDTITAEKLNHMEQGIEDASAGGGGGSNVIVLHLTEDEGYYYPQFTVEEFKNAVNAYCNNEAFVYCRVNQGYVVYLPSACSTAYEADIYDMSFTNCLVDSSDRTYLYELRLSCRENDEYVNAVIDFIALRSN